MLMRVLLVLAALSLRASAQTIYVNSAATGAVSGLAWADAFKLLQPALDAASPGDEIWVAAGTYVPTTDYGLVAGTGQVQARLKHFRLKNGVGLYGGFAGIETSRDQRDWKTNVTILSGDLNGNGFDANDSYHVFYHPSGTALDPNAILDGFTVTGGNANGPSPFDSGACMHNYGCSPTIANCTFTGHAVMAGGGIYSLGGFSAISDCLFTGNVTAAYPGGGAALYTRSSLVYPGHPVVSRCTFTANVATGGCGSAVSCGGQTGSLTIRQCIFTDNRLSGADYNAGGGAIAFYGQAMDIDRCTFANNAVVSDKSGGAIWAFDYISSLSVTGCTFVGNTAPGAGAIYAHAWLSTTSTSIVGCTFRENHGDSGGGGAIYLDTTRATVADCNFIRNIARSGGAVWTSSSPLSLSRCRFVGNVAGGSGGGLYSNSPDTTVRDTLFAGNIARNGGGIYSNAADLSVTQSALVDNRVYIGTGSTASYGRGGGINASGAGAKITNSLLWNNKAYLGDAVYCGTSTAIANSILWNDSSVSVCPVFGGAAVTCSDIRGGMVGAGNIDSDPLLFRPPSAGPDGAWVTDDDDYGDLRLRPGSPCIDSGDNFVVPSDVTADMAGNPRFADDPDVSDTGPGTSPIVDMGVYEGRFAKVERPTVSPSGGRYDSDVAVTVSCPTEGAAIHYTTDGSEPDELDPVVQDCAVIVSVSPPTTLKVRAFCPGSLPSDVATNAYYRPAIIYVSASGNDANDGLSWPSAKRTLQAALDAAGPYNDIWITQGTFYPTVKYGGTADAYKAFQMKNDVGIFGGFSGTEILCGQRDWRTNPTILSGDLNDNGTFSSTDSTHVFYHPIGTWLNRTALLDGCTVTGGTGYNKGISTSSILPGAGMCNEFSGPTVRNCSFVRNCVAGYPGNNNPVPPQPAAIAGVGGGIYTLGGSPLIQNCIFRTNLIGEGKGGAVASLASRADIEDCTFSGNAGTYGAAVYNESSRAVFSGCIFRDHYGGYGAGICDLGADVDISSCTFVGNFGSTVYNDCSGARLIYSLLTNGSGTAVYGTSSTMSIANCTIAANYGRGIVKYAGSATLSNSILWGNSPSTGIQIYESGAATTVSYCDVQNSWPGTGNIASDPLFAVAPTLGPDGQWGTSDDVVGNAWLAAGSPCIDVGSNGLVPDGVMRDLAGRRRIVDGNGDGNDVVDMGAFERQCVTDPPGDAMCDCGVDFLDLSVIAGKWSLVGCSAANNWCSRADVDQSGSVDMLDVAVLAANWLVDSRDIPDFAPSRTIDSADLAVLFANWLRTDCGPANDWCQRADMDSSGTIDLLDLARFSSYWLEGI